MAIEFAGAISAERRLAAAHAARAAGTENLNFVNDEVLTNAAKSALLWSSLEKLISAKTPNYDNVEKWVRKFDLDGASSATMVILACVALFDESVVAAANAQVTAEDIKDDIDAETRNFLNEVFKINKKKSALVKSVKELRECFNACDEIENTAKRVIESVHGAHARKKSNTGVRQKRSREEEEIDPIAFMTETKPRAVESEITQKNEEKIFPAIESGIAQKKDDDKKTRVAEMFPAPAQKNIEETLPRFLPLKKMAEGKLKEPVQPPKTPEVMNTPKPVVVLARDEIDADMLAKEWGFVRRGPEPQTQNDGWDGDFMKRVACVFGKF